MMVLTRQQRKALKMVFDRTPLFQWWNGKSWMTHSTEGWMAQKRLNQPVLTYRQFRKLAMPSFGTLCVPWCGMWLAIEENGYTHS